MTQTARDLRPGRGTGLDTPLSASGRRVPRLAPNPDAFGEATEGIARFMGTPQFLVWMTLFCAAWLGWNTFGPMEWRFDSAELGFTALTLMLSLQASYAAPLLLLAQNRQDDRDRVALREDRDRAERNLADTEFLTREIAGLRLAVQEVATRDFVRGELRGVQDVDAEPVGEQPRRPEGALHRELLVEQHAQEQGERVAAEQLVGGGVLGDAEGRHTEMVPYAVAPAGCHRSTAPSAGSPSTVGRWVIGRSSPSSAPSRWARE